MNSKSFWANDSAEKAIGRHKPPFVVNDWKTPSGSVHVGALRGVVVHDAIARILKGQGREVRFIYGFDDFDAFKKIPSGLNTDAYKEYLGVPLSRIPAPSPDGSPLPDEISKNNNFAKFFADEFEKVYRTLGVDSETLYTSLLYESGQFNDAIKIALDSADVINDIYEQVIAHKSSDRAEKPAVKRELPINMVCEQCGKIATTKPISWNGEVVEYSCEGDVEEFAEGCGYTGKNSPLNGNAKLPWKVEWAAKWFTFKTDIEGAGKDHYTKGGSRDVALEIFRQIYAPILPEGYNRPPEDLFYEWFYLEGKKMSTSKGYGVTAKDVLDRVSPEILRMLMVRTKPKTAVSFKDEPEATLVYFDELDRLRVGYLADKNSLEGQIFTLSRLDSNTLDGELPHFTLRFSKIITLIQLPHINLGDEAQKEKGNPLSPSEIKDLEYRAEVAKKWLEDAPDEYKLKLQTGELPDLSPAQIDFLKKLKDLYNTKDSWQGDDLHKEIHNLKNDLQINPKEAFNAIYQLFLGRDSGPQAGWFMAALDREYILERLSKI